MPELIFFGGWAVVLFALGAYERWKPASRAWRAAKAAAKAAAKRG